MKIGKYGSKIHSNLPICDTFCKSERFFYYLVCPQQKPLEDFQNSSPVGQKLILKLTTKPVIYAVCLVSSAQQNPLHGKILCATESSAQKNLMHGKILCATKSLVQKNPLRNKNPMCDKIPYATKPSARQNPLHGEILCAEKSSAQQHPLRGEIHYTTRSK
jgi:hypothetical protein